MTGLLAFVCISGNGISLHFVNFFWFQLCWLPAFSCNENGVCVDNVC